MKLRKLLYFFFFNLLISCGVLPPENNFHETKNTLELGTIGIKKKSSRKTDFEELGTPYYQGLIKFSVISKSFDKNTYNKYLKSVKNKKVFNKINYVDSLKIKPSYLEIKISDKVAVIKAINNDNPSLCEYMKNAPKAKLITSLRLTASKSLITQVLKGDAFYLTSDTQKKQRLYIYKNQVKIGEINTNENDVFAYEMGSFCWELTAKRKIKLATIIGPNESCTNSTKEKARD
ncbi:hypothetical protein [Tenacibaculum finnmarkense]|uniref:hypothetical protein n=1 Tax=Tenacibaculum finnmarkense TaxID=2781243 RepID=UPI001E528F1A|nr:hypothetical protein [Tenacibaculum finnmarkense]MCD8406198.1 hypothetical protein [Tenacibaculum dicentrarchi]MCD8413422.1 hypothetical protein [Tenacibaculum finnmarkense genomovar ulcerans]